MKAGELVIAYAWWEEELGWLSITETNQWPPLTAILTTWKVKNTGDESAVFKTRLLGGESAEAWLTPGATFFFEYPAISLSLGTHQFTLEILADSQVVATYPIRVVTTKEGMNLLPLVIGGGVVLGGLALVVAKARRR